MVGYIKLFLVDVSFVTVKGRSGFDVCLKLEFKVILIASIIPVYISIQVVYNKAYHYLVFYVT